MVTAQYLSDRSDTERLLLRALMISLLIHLTVFGVWKWGQTEGWWRNFTFPAWMHFTPRLLKPLAAKQIAVVPKQQSQPSQLNFVDVDPALAEPVPPKAPKFYSANNSVAANPHPKYAALPEILGKQDKVIKTTPNTKLQPQPLQPSPAVKETADTLRAKALPKKALRSRRSGSGPARREAAGQKWTSGHGYRHRRAAAAGPPTPAHHCRGYGATRHVRRKIAPARGRQAVQNGFLAGCDEDFLRGL